MCRGEELAIASIAKPAKPSYIAVIERAASREVSSQCLWRLRVVLITPIIWHIFVLSLSYWQSEQLEAVSGCYRSSYYIACHARAPADCE